MAPRLTRRRFPPNPPMPAPERDLFLQALELGTPADRLAFLDRACRDQPALRERVEGLLHCHLQAGDFLDGASSEAPPPPDPLSEGPGTVIGRYKLLEKIGEGGFGVVYMAEQREPVKRRVALKIIKLGMDTRQVVGRFEAERQALALMDHPNIARVLDGGATATGRPYFVMELVRGVPITQFCDEQRLDPADRLELFIEVCAALQHAHQKGIIHRDIKPSNVLVTLHDDRPVPKVIDFGIAKAMQGELTDKTVFTRFHEFLGTPAYMSPEQTQLSGLDVDTRTDIYALGVLLYELLTGRTPFDARELLTASLEEIRRRIRDEEPARPSTRLRALPPPDADTVARNRRSYPARLALSLRGDLDWIVLKCLEKDRARRYDSTGALVLDLRRHLRDEPVTAVKPSFSYRASKLLRRHRTAFAVAAGFLLLLVAATVVSSAFALRAFRAERATRQEAAVKDAVHRFLNDDLFNHGDIVPGSDRQVTLRTLLDRASDQLNPRLGDQPAIEAAIRSTLGRTYYNLGEYAAAEAQWRAALELHLQLAGERDRRTLLARSDLSRALISLDRRTEALEAAQQVLALARSQFRPRDPLLVKFLSRLASACYRIGDADGARAAAAEAIALAEASPGVEVADVANALDILGRMIGRTGDLEGGERYVRQALERVRTALGDSHPLTIRYSNRLGAYLYNVGIKTGEAESLYRTSLTRQQQAFGDAHPITHVVRANLALLYAYREPHRPHLALDQWLAILAHHPPDQPDTNLLARIRTVLDRLPPDTLAPPPGWHSQPWRLQTYPPPPGWSHRDFDDRYWSPHPPTGRSEVWMRQTLTLDEPPGTTPFLVLRSPGTFDIFLNGIPVVAGAVVPESAFRLIPFPDTARATLRPGRNLLALHVRDRSLDGPVHLDILHTPGSDL
ncbi:MAG: serine/threonine protein kinase [Verrucomicrobiae bacterium]|nr:serine/threonine protein kinase [Verrucomicrobiae bacterium]